MLQIVVSLTIVTDKLLKDRVNITFSAQASLTIITNDLQNIFQAQATGLWKRICASLGRYLQIKKERKKERK